MGEPAVIPCLLALADGTLWPGRAFGAIGERTGEICFNTSLTGYQEILTDPSYHGQIVVMSQPHIGNTGVNAEDDESQRAWLSGFVVRAASPITSNWRATQSLDDYLRERGVVAISEVDTRALVRHIRTVGAQNAALASVDPQPDRLDRPRPIGSRHERPRSGERGHCARSPLASFRLTTNHQLLTTMLSPTTSASSTTSSACWPIKVAASPSCPRRPLRPTFLP